MLVKFSRYTVSSFDITTMDTSPHYAHPAKQREGRLLRRRECERAHRDKLGKYLNATCRSVLITARISLRAKVFFSVGAHYLTLNAIDSNVSEIVQHDEVTTDSLLSATPLTLT